MPLIKNTRKDKLCGLLEKEQLPVCIFYEVRILSGHFYPCWKESAPNGVTDGLDIRPCCAIEWYFATVENLNSKSACKCGGDTELPKLRQYIHTDLPHGFTVRAATCHANERFAVISSCSKNVEVLTPFT